MAQQLVACSRPNPLPAIVAASGERAGLRFREFFAAATRNPNTRRAYSRAAVDFPEWCSCVCVTALSEIQPLDVASWVELRPQELSAPSVNQAFAGVRHLFGWLMAGQVAASNPAASVRRPAHSASRGQIPVPTADEERTRLDEIDITTPIWLNEGSCMQLRLVQRIAIAPGRHLALTCRSLGAPVSTQAHPMVICAFVGT